MMKNSISQVIFLKVFIIFLIVQIPFQNFFLNQTSLGILGSNMSLIAINFTFLLIVLLKFDYIKFPKRNLFLILSFIIISLFFLFFTNFYVKNTNLMVKTINNFILYSQPFIVFYVFDYLFRNNSCLIRTAIITSLYVFLFLLLYLIFDSYGIFTLDSNIILHGFENANMRQRLFSSESSMAITVFITFGIIASMQLKNIYFKLFIILCISYGSILLQSKGGFLTLLLICIWSLKVLKFRDKLILVFFIIALFIISFDAISDFIQVTQSGFSEYTSLSTRLTMVFASIISLFYNPFGSGFGAYLVFFDPNIIGAEKIVKSLFNYFNLTPNFSEVDSYLSSVESYSTKSMLFNSIMFYGWLGLIFFIYLHYQIYKKIGKNITLKILFLFLLLTHIIFVDSLYLYHFWFAFALIYNYWRINVKKNINYRE